MAAPFRLYNTLSRSVEDFESITPGEIGLYVCGMTVYDRPHIGHAMANVIFDTFVRYLRFRGWKVNFVRNFTDVDVKIIARAQQEGENPTELAKRYIEAFHEDADALGLARPDHEPRVTENIDGIREVIQRLIDKDHAYLSENTVWFDVKSFGDYGKLSGQNVDALRSPDSVPGKRHPADFAIWKAVKPGEPSWESPWGAGRPGWHIECSAMSMGLLGETFDIHCGGLDLVFPHHENEIAQSEGASGQTFARYWMHNGLLTMASGKKMGKSLGNMVSVASAIAEFPAETLRLYYLQNHYRSPLPWGEEALPDALALLSRLYEAREVAEAMGGQEDPQRVVQDLGPDAQQVVDLAQVFEARFLAALDEDFNTSMALGALFELARAVNRFANHKKAKKRGGPVVASALRCFALLNESLGLLRMSVDDFHDEVKNKRLKAMGIDRTQIEADIIARTAARQNKDWAQADTLRQTLDDRGIVLMDGTEGTSWRVRL
jgi:cysteinyl-tRNA synthetase